MSIFWAFIKAYNQKKGNDNIKTIKTFSYGIIHYLTPFLIILSSTLYFKLQNY